MIIAAPETTQAPEDSARTLLSQGRGLEDVAIRTGLSVTDVQAIAEGEQPDVTALVEQVHARLRDLGMSMLAASKRGILSRSTLITMGKGGRIPSDLTLDKLDELLMWERGSARSVMFGHAPTAREEPTHSRVQPVKNTAEYDFNNLVMQIEQRLRELNMSKMKFSRIGGPARSTLATIGRRGFHPAPETLARIDRTLLWEPGSAETALKGGLPIRRGADPNPPPTLVPLNAVLERQRRLLAQLTRYEQGIEQMKAEVQESINHVNLAMSDLEESWRRAVITASSQDRAEHHEHVRDDTDAAHDPGA